MVNCLHGTIVNEVYHKSLFLTLGPLLLLIYINNLLDGLTTNARLFADDVLLFSVVHNTNLSATNLNSDLSKINASTNQWKMTFNPYSNHGDNNQINVNDKKLL